MDAAIVGWGHTPFGVLRGKSFGNPILDAGREALDHAGVAAADVDAVWIGHFNAGMVEDAFPSSLVLGPDDALRFKPATRVENACAPGAAAYAEAGIGVDDLDVAEVHDCFTIAELLIYEAMGLAEKGQGARLVAAGDTLRGGRLAVNLSGGLKAKGHPVGASGVSMHVLAAQQVTGAAGAMQLPGAELALVYNMGGSGVANYVSVLEPRG